MEEKESASTDDRIKSNDDNMLHEFLVNIRGATSFIFNCSKIFYLFDDSFFALPLNCTLL